MTVSHRLLLTQVALALSDNYIVAVTTKDYVRVYTLFGTPYRIYRQKSPAVTCAAWRDYVMTVGNGSVGAHGHATLKYSIENVKRDEIYQNEDVVALPEGAELKNVFFSDNGVSSHWVTVSLSDMLIVFRTPVYMTPMAFYLFSSIGARKVKLAGCRSWTRSSWNVWLVGARRRPIGQSQWLRTNSTVSS